MVNTLFPATYQSQLPSYVPNQQTWVDGIEAARSYPVSPGTTVILLDSQNPIVYKKTADATGRPLPLEVYDLVRHEEIVAEQPAYVKQSDFDSFCSRIEKMIEDIDYEEEVVRRPKRRRKRHESSYESDDADYQ